MAFDDLGQVDRPSTGASYSVRRARHRGISTWSLVSGVAAAAWFLVGYYSPAIQSTATYFAVLPAAAAVALGHLSREVSPLETRARTRALVGLTAGYTVIGAVALSVVSGVLIGWHTV